MGVLAVSDDCPTPVMAAWERLERACAGAKMAKGGAGQDLPSSCGGWVGPTLFRGMIVTLLRKRPLLSRALAVCSLSTTTCKAGWPHD